MPISTKSTDAIVRELERALEESIKLQSHYAELLNMHDGGHRKIFKNKEEWLNRLEGNMGEIR
jgi:hypothetical protein